MNPLLELKKQQAEEQKNEAATENKSEDTSRVLPKAPSANDLFNTTNQPTPPVPPPPEGLVNIPTPPGLETNANTQPPAPPVPPIDNKEVVKVPTPIKPGANKKPRTLYAWNTGKKMTEEQRKIIESGKSPEELTSEELRKVYYHVTAIPGRKIYSATTVNYIEDNGVHPDEGDREENEYMFVGNEVHSAMETKGESLKRLQCYADAGEVPEKPADVKLSKDHENLLYEIVVNNCTPGQAYMKTKSTTATKEITLEQLMEFEKDQTIYDHEDLKSDEGKELTKQKKAVEKVINNAKKEWAKIEMHRNTYGKYLKDKDKWEIKKQQLREKGGFIIDDLDYISDSGKAGKRIRDRIKACYGSLSSNAAIMEYYYMEDKNPEFESYVELPILWKVQIGNRQLPAKSMLDKVHFDFTNKKVYIQDIKTHGRKKHEFISTNYVNHRYYRTMSFYTEAVKYYLEHYRGIKDVDTWGFYNILFPISTISYEVGCYHPFLSISQNDIIMGKFGGFRKPENYTLFDVEGAVQYCLDQTLFDKAKEIGFVHENAADYKIKGWMEVIDKFERQFKPSV